MQWTIKYTQTALKGLLSIDKKHAQKIKKYLEEKIAVSENPRAFGKALTSNLSGLWRYRIGDYRVVAEIQDNTFIILAVGIGHRSKIYGGH